MTDQNFYGFLHSHERWLRRYGLACLWLWLIPLYIADGFQVQHLASAWFGQAQPYPVTELLANIALSGGAVLLLYLIIRPRSFHFSQNRVVLSLIVFLLGFFVASSGFADPPGFQNAQMLWLLSVIVILFVALFLTSGTKHDTRNDTQKRGGASHVRNPR